MVDRNIDLIITDGCNLNCVYCYEHNKQARMMNFDTAKSIIDAEFSKQFDFYNISFFGGEPFLNFPLIKRISEYIWNSEMSSKCKISVSTNGTMFDSEIRSWLTQNSHRFFIGLSLDGTEETQNRNRSNSSSLIDLDFILSLKEVYIKATVSPYTIDHLFDDVKYLYSLGVEFTINLALDYKWDMSNLDIFAKQMIKIVDWTLENDPPFLCRLLDVPMESVSPDSPKTVPKYCGAGTKLITYDVDGRRYPCQMFAPMSFKKDQLAVEFTEYIDICALDKKCQVCPLVAGCPTCYGANYNEFGNLYSKNLFICRTVIIQYIAASNYWIRHIKAECDKHNRLPDEREAKILSRARTVYEFYYNLIDDDSEYSICKKFEKGLNNGSPDRNTMPSTKTISQADDYDVDSAPQFDFSIPFHTRR